MEQIRSKYLRLPFAFDIFPINSVSNVSISVNLNYITRIRIGVNKVSKPKFHYNF